MSLAYKVFFGGMSLIAVLAVAAYLIDKRRAEKERGMFHQYGIEDDND